jgi:hypothetical protein
MLLKPSPPALTTTEPKENPAMATQTNTTRRALVSSLAALPVAAAAPVLAGEHPDAELLRLGDALKRAVAMVDAFPSEEAHGTFYATIRAIRDRGESLDNNLDELQAGCAQVDRENELRQAAHHIQDAIHKIAPRTVDGLKVHAEALAWAFSDAWDEPLDAVDWPDGCVRRFVEAARALPGPSV